MEPPNSLLVRKDPGRPHPGCETLLVSTILTVLPSHEADVTVLPTLGALKRLIIPKIENVSLYVR